MKRFFCCVLTLLAMNGLAMDDEKGYMGVSLETVDEVGKAPVVRIGKVYKDSGAQTAGVKRGDVVVGFQGVDITSNEELTEALQNYGPGDVVTLSVARDGETLDLDIELGGSAMVKQYDFNFRFGNKMLGFVKEDRAYMGVDLMELDGQLAEYFGVEGGVLIKSVREESPAAAAGLKAGDVVTRLGEHDVTNSHDLTEALATYKPGDTVNVDVKRKGKAKSLKVTTENAKDHYGSLMPRINMEGLQMKGLENFQIHGLEGLEALKGLEGLEGLTKFELKGDDFKNFRFDFDTGKLKLELEGMKDEIEKMKKEMKKELKKEFEKENDQ